MNSLQIYKDFEAAYQDVKEQLHAFAPGYSVRLTFWSGYQDAPYFAMELSKYPIEEKVEGRHLQEMVDELIRRHSFKQRQNTLQLGAPVVESVVTKVEEDDEIPF